MVTYMCCFAQYIHPFATVGYGFAAYLTVASYQALRDPDMCIHARGLYILITNASDCSLLCLAKLAVLFSLNDDMEYGSVLFNL